jgi:hypothetical protein
MVRTRRSTRRVDSRCSDIPVRGFSLRMAQILASDFAHAGSRRGVGLLQTIHCKQSTANNPMQTIHCKQSKQTIQANNSTPNKSTANNPMQTIQLSSRAQRGISVLIPSAAEGSRFLRRGFDYTSEFSLHTVTDRPPRAQKRRIGGAPGNWGTSRLSPGFPSRVSNCHPERSRGILVVIPSAGEGSRLSSRAQRRDLGFFGAASITSGNSHRTP